MDTQPDDGNADQRPSIDPLRRVFVPIERKTANGTTVFRTTDGEVYMRHVDGSIRRSRPKVNGKIAKKMRRKAGAA